MRRPSSFSGIPASRLSLATGFAFALALGGGTLAARGGLQIPPRPDPPMGGIQWARGQRPAARPVKSPDMTYHGGPVQHGTAVTAILWGARWADATFVGDKESGLASFYEGLGNSTYADTNTEYTDASGNVSAAVSSGGAIVDTSTAPRSGNRTSPILAEVCRIIGSNAVPNGYYPVYVDSPRGHSGFCAWHSAGTCPNGTTVQFAFFYNLDGDSGCDPQDTSGLHSQGLAALANVSGHEISEMLTDPHLNAWYDANGQENADKCAWTFGTPLLTFTNGTQWKVQGNWSNAANDGGTGYPNGSGLKGCIDGGNYR